MTNEEILEKRWTKTDNILKSYLNQIRQLGIYTVDCIIGFLYSLNISYEDLKKPISKVDKRILDNNITKWKKQGIFTGYFKLLVSTKNKLTYYDLIEIMIYAYYIEQENSLKDISKEVYIHVAEDIYKQALEEIPCKPKKDFSLTWEFIYSLLWIPTYNKHWEDYLSLLTLTNHQEMYKLITGIYQQSRNISDKNLYDLVNKQSNRVLSINIDKYSGVLSDTCRLLGNEVYIKPFQDQKDLQVRFVAEIDRHTTKMCKGMNNMLFYVNDWNRFYRYSDLDKKDVLYTVFGLEIGINLPPIANHFHWCRSTITYQIDTTL